MKVLSEVLTKPKLQAATLKRLGVCGFLFFFIKGVLWLALPFFLLAD